MKCGWNLLGYWIATLCWTHLISTKNSSGVAYPFTDSNFSLIVDESIGLISRLSFEILSSDNSTLNSFRNYCEQKSICDYYFLIVKTLSDFGPQIILQTSLSASIRFKAIFSVPGSNFLHKPTFQ